MQALECGCKVDVTYHATEGATIILAVNLFEWCPKHNTAQVVLLGASGVLSVAKKGEEPK